MICKYSSLFLLLNIFVFCESAFVDTLTKCSINDAECGKKLLHKVIQGIASTGVPEIGLPSIDPMELKSITLNVVDVIEISLIDAQAEGIKNCAIDKFEIVIEDERAFFELTCDLTVKGKYKMFSSSSIIKNLLNGETLHGEGNGKIDIEKLKLNFDFFFSIQKQEGELYIIYDADKTKYDFDIKGGLKLIADKLYIGEVESSEKVLSVLNENWKILMSTFGKAVMDEAMPYVYSFIQKFFDTVPVKYYIIEDLLPYVKH